MKRYKTLDMISVAKRKLSQVLNVNFPSFIGVDLKVASKFFGSKFACGSSCAASKGEIVIQGDVKEDLFDIIPEKWPEVCGCFLKKSCIKQLLD